MGLFMIGFNMTVEMVGPKWKTFVGNAFQIPFAIGEAIVSLIAYACTGRAVSGRIRAGSPRDKFHPIILVSCVPQRVAMLESIRVDPD